MQMNLSVIILAAGQGIRFKSSTSKVLHKIAGTCILNLICNAVQQLTSKYKLPIAQTIIISGKNTEQLKINLIDPNKSLLFITQEQQLGTGHAVQCALPYLQQQDTRVLILVGDTPLISSATLQKLITTTPTNSLGMLTSQVQNPTGLGRIIRDQNNNTKIIQIIEEKDATPEQLAIQEINPGIYLVAKYLLDKWLPKLSTHNSQQEYYLTDIIAMAVQDNISIHSVLVDEYEIQGINTRIQLAAAERKFQRYQAEQYMLGGVTLLDPSRFDVRGEVEIHQDVTIDINVVLEGLPGNGEIITGKTLIESNVIIEANVIIRNSHIKSGSRILANSIIESAVIGNNCQVGPFARVRPGTILNAGVKIGNFVEIKKSILGIGSKVNHLSYIGDAEIGKDVNIGAGTITCNYDGINKCPTIIEDDVFIGSGTQLIAPITVGKGATIAAGTTLIKDAPAGNLTLTQKLQKTVLNWVRPVKIEL